MDEWISKKELLSETGISYGQLYRWKREKLIPDAWFEKRSAFTGQETYFPRALAIERVRFILAHKDEYSLTQLRGLLTPNASSRSYELNAIARLSNAARAAGVYAEINGSAPVNHGQALDILISSGYDAACAPTDEALKLFMRTLGDWHDTDNLYEQSGGCICVIACGALTVPICVSGDKPPLLPQCAQVAYTLALSEITRTYTRALNQIYDME